MSSIQTLKILVLAAAAAALASGASQASAETFANGKSWYGVPNSAEVATQVVDMKQARHLNIKCGETVTFRNSDKSFTWRFDVAGHRSFDLRKIAPAGFTSEPFMVYVRANAFERS